MSNPCYIRLGRPLGPHTLDMAGPKSRRLGFGKHVRLTLLWTWCQPSPSIRVWQMCLTHVYLDLANMLNSRYFGLGYPPSPRTLDVADAKSRHLGSVNMSDSRYLGLENMHNPRLLGSDKHAR